MFPKSVYVFLDGMILKNSGTNRIVMKERGLFFSISYFYHFVTPHGPA